MLRKQSGYGTGRVWKIGKRISGSRVFILSLRDLVAISKINVPLGNGGGILCQSVEKRTKTGWVAPKFYATRNTNIKTGAERNVSQIITLK